MDGWTDFLYARPSLLGGAASALDIGGTLHIFNDSRTGAEADAIAIRADWRAIGADLQKAIDEHRKLEQESQLRLF
jgi:hypothetical protein